MTERTKKTTKFCPIKHKQCWKKNNNRLPTNYHSWLNVDFAHIYIRHGCLAWVHDTLTPKAVLILSELLLTIWCTGTKPADKTLMHGKYHAANLVHVKTPNFTLWVWHRRSSTVFISKHFQRRQRCWAGVTLLRTIQLHSGVVGTLYLMTFVMTVQPAGLKHRQ